MNPDCDPTPKREYQLVVRYSGLEPFQVGTMITQFLRDYGVIPEIEIFFETEAADAEK